MNQGTYNDDLGTDASKHDSSADCEECPSGELSSSDRYGCASCLPGQFANTTLYECQDCQAGRYAPTAQSGQCLECSAGFHTQVPSAATACTACDAGSMSGTNAVNCR